MGPAYEVEVVSVQELGHHVRAEGEAHAPVVLAPTLISNDSLVYNKMDQTRGIYSHFDHIPTFLPLRK